MSMEPKDLDATRCPLCGKPNECAIASGRPPESCWCMTATIDPTTLAAIPEEARGQVCICAGCAAARPSES